jgi:hypothetical protein
MNKIDKIEKDRTHLCKPICTLYNNVTTFLTSDFSSNSFKNPCIITPDSDVFILNFLNIKFPRNVCMCSSVMKAGKLIANIQFLYWSGVFASNIQDMKSRTDFPSTGDGKVKFPKHPRISWHLSIKQPPRNETGGNLSKKTYRYYSSKMWKLVTKNL